MSAVRVPGVFATSFEPEGTPVGTALLVPGRGYPAAAPLLFFAGVALLQHGWSVRQVWWDPPPHDSDEQTTAWVRARVEEMLPDGGRVMLVSKSLGTYAAPLAAERGLEAVWFTPLLQNQSLVAAIGANPARQLLVGGTADDLAWRADVARSLAEQGCDVCEIPGADHALLVPGDSVRAVQAHVTAARALDGFLSRPAEVGALYR
jgi:predicted alpha/beta-hydrolase family hydrolase